MQYSLCTHAALGKRHSCAHAHTHTQLLAAKLETTMHVEATTDNNVRHSKGMGLHVLMLILFQGQQDQSDDLYVHIVRCHLTQRLSELRPACTT